MVRSPADLIAPYEFALEVRRTRFYAPETFLYKTETLAPRDDGSLIDISNMINRHTVKRTTVAYCMTTLLAVATLPCVSAAQPKGRPPPDSSSTRPSAPDRLSTAASRWDLNQDGVFTCEEWKQFVGSAFARADKNRDGFLSAGEFQVLRSSEAMFADADPAYFDDDRDQRVSKKEFVDKPNPFFVRYDLNGDCRVTAQEMKGPAANVNREKGAPGKGGAMGMPGRGAF